MDTIQRENPELRQKAIRLNKYLALAGIGSRRSNDELIRSGVVRVNGRVVQELGIRIDPRKDRVTVRGNPVSVLEKKVYILLNKPKDTITTVSDERGRMTVMDYVNVKERVYPVGRLDRNTTGVLLLTNDGELAHALTHPKYEIEKVYHVRLERGITDDDLRQLKEGVRLKDGIAKPTAVQTIPKTKRTELFIALHEGRNREVRRMLEELGYEVKRLERVSFAGITTTGLARGKWRKLTAKEVEHLKRVAGIPLRPI